MPSRTAPQEVFAATGLSSAEDLSVETDVVTDYKQHKFIDLNRPMFMQMWKGGVLKRLLPRAGTQATALQGRPIRASVRKFLGGFEQDALVGGAHDLATSCCLRHHPCVPESGQPTAYNCVLADRDGHLDHNGVLFTQVSVSCGSVRHSKSALDLLLMIPDIFLITESASLPTSCCTVSTTTSQWTGSAWSCLLPCL